ncbi:MAG: tol-pal system-associated acyl-CoA thioesterase [Methylophilaceae bacterium]
MAAVVSESKKPHTWPIRVYYEDTDSGGVVYHSNYLNFMERARTEWLRELGFEQTYLKDELNVVFVVHSVVIDFKKPAKFNDLLTVNSEITKAGRVSLEFLQKISINSQLLVQAQVKVACVNILSFKPTAIPKSVLLKMESI